MGVRKLVKRIAKDGCGGILCSDCIFSRNGSTCAANVMYGITGVKAKAVQWLKDNPKKAKEKPEWDGQFVSGKFYTSGSHIVFCQDGKSGAEDYFYGVLIKSDINKVGIEVTNSTWLKEHFRPCEVEIKVKP